MSYYAYSEGLKLALQDPPFYALIQAAMRKADTNNLEKLTDAFPDVWKDLQARYHSPGGLLPGERSEEAYE